MRSSGLRFLVVILLTIPALTAQATRPGAWVFDFARPEALRLWTPAHDIGALATVKDGMSAAISGADPYLFGPPMFGLPEGELWLDLTVWSAVGGRLQIFWFDDKAGPKEEHSAVRSVPAGRPTDLRIPLPPLAEGARLRIDPPGAKDICVFGKAKICPRASFPEPKFKRPAEPNLGDSPILLRLGHFTLRHSRTLFAQWDIVDSEGRLAAAHTDPPIGVSAGGAAAWLDAEKLIAQSVREMPDGIEALAVYSDGVGNEWTTRYVLRPKSDSETTATLLYDAELRYPTIRPLLYWNPVLLLLGSGSFGQKKTEALLPGVEWLDAEPTEVSSSEKDVIGPRAMRRTPPPAHVTQPYMAFAYGGRTLALSWRGADPVSPLFDCPDRTFDSGANLIGLVVPPTDSDSRFAGRLLPLEGAVLHLDPQTASAFPGRRLDTDPGATATARVTGMAIRLAAGENDLTDCIRAMTALPPVREEKDFLAVDSLVVSGLLESKIREKSLFRHAVSDGEGFPPGPAPDAALTLEYVRSLNTKVIASEPIPPIVREILRDADAGRLDEAGISHVRSGRPSLIFGGVQQNAARAAAIGRAALKTLDAEGRVIYHPAAGAEDLSLTHYAKDANGLTAATVLTALEAAMNSGNPELTNDAIAALRKLARYDGGVPRGAQTWEVPLHTPDILAAAHLTLAWTIGFELTGEAEMKDRAERWAVRGLPFLYLDPAARKSPSFGASVAVFGATGRRAPVWIGLPVQWCGLVYAHAILRYVQATGDEKWRGTAQAIVDQALLEIAAERGNPMIGLLPDSFEPSSAAANPPFINPISWFLVHAEAFRRPAILDRKLQKKSGALVSAPGFIRPWVDEPGKVEINVTPWSKEPVYVSVTNGPWELKTPPAASDKGLAIVENPDHPLTVLRIQGPRFIALRKKAQNR